MTKARDLVQDLAEKRDELRVQIHLGSMEARQQWEALERKWERFAARAGLEETSEVVEESLKSLGAELAKGYDKLREALR